MAQGKFEEAIKLRGKYVMSDLYYQDMFVVLAKYPLNKFMDFFCIQLKLKTKIYHLLFFFHITDPLII